MAFPKELNTPVSTPAKLPVKEAAELELYVVPPEVTTETETE